MTSLSQTSHEAEGSQHSIGSTPLSSYWSISILLCHHARDMHTRQIAGAKYGASWCKAVCRLKPTRQTNCPALVSGSENKSPFPLPGQLANDWLRMRCKQTRCLSFVISRRRRRHHDNMLHYQAQATSLTTTGRHLKSGRACNAKPCPLLTIHP